MGIFNSFFLFFSPNFFLKRKSNLVVIIDKIDTLFSFLSNVGFQRKRSFKFKQRFFFLFIYSLMIITFLSPFLLNGARPNSEVHGLKDFSLS